MSPIPPGTLPGARGEPTNWDLTAASQDVTVSLHHTTDLSQAIKQPDRKG
ncbi:hypothetical protein [Streptomyces cadmiisoli]|nr:hypothetical protein [Streptomyces cadmiisoli]